MGGRPEGGDGGDGGDDSEAEFMRDDTGKTVERIQMIARIPGID